MHAEDIDRPTSGIQGCFGAAGRGGATMATTVDIQDVQ